MPRLFFFVPMSGCRTPFYNWLGQEFPINSSVAFADDVPIPIRNVHDQITCAIWYALATEATVRRETRRKREFFFFCVGHFRDRLEPLSDDAVAGGACTHTTARMVDINAVSKRDIQDAAGQTGQTIRDLLGVDFNSHIHWKKSDREFLRRRNRRFLIDVRIRTTHICVSYRYFTAASC